MDHIRELVVRGGCECARAIFGGQSFPSSATRRRGRVGIVQPRSARPGGVETLEIPLAAIDAERQDGIAPTVRHCRRRGKPERSRGRHHGDGLSITQTIRVTVVRRRRRRKFHHCERTAVGRPARRGTPRARHVHVVAVDVRDPYAFRPASAPERDAVARRRPRRMFDGATAHDGATRVAARERDPKLRATFRRSNVGDLFPIGRECGPELHAGLRVGESVLATVG